MINVKNEIQYILVIQVLEDMTAAGFLTADELVTAKQLAMLRYEPENVWE